MPEIHAPRRDALRAVVAELDADAALVTNLVNVRYLTGLASSNAALLLPAAGEPVLATDFRYALTAERECADLERATEYVVDEALAELAAKRGYRRLAFEAHVVSVERFETLKASQPLEFVPLGHAVEQLRVVKDETEIALLTRACQITGAAFDAVVGQVRPGLTEQGLAVLVERAMVDHGAECLAFPTIVASGPNGAIPHHVPGERPIAAGDMVTVDCGARYAGYHADMTRTVVVGEPAGWQRDVYSLVDAAQQAGIQAAVAGAAVAAVDESARGLITAAGHGEHFSHGLGHGVGLEIHELPAVGRGRPGTLADRVPITVEPGVYLPGMGGVRIEDTLVVRSGGGTSRDLLTTTTTVTPGELAVL